MGAGVLEGISLSGFSNRDVVIDHPCGVHLEARELLSELPEDSGVLVDGRLLDLENERREIVFSSF